MDRNQFRLDLAIDPNGLDLECLRQPEAFFRWAQEAADAKARLDKAELALEVATAQLELDCRKDPAAFALEPGARGGAPTVDAVKAAVRVHPKYLAAQEAYLAAKDDSNILDKAVAAMEQKKRMLESLITLHGQSYFAGPSVPRDLGASYLAQKRASEEALNNKHRKVLRKRTMREA